MKIDRGTRSTHISAHARSSIGFISHLIWFAFFSLPFCSLPKSICVRTHYKRSLRDLECDRLVYYCQYGLADIVHVMSFVLFLQYRCAMLVGWKRMYIGLSKMLRRTSIMHRIDMSKCWNSHCTSAINQIQYIVPHFSSFSLRLVPIKLGKPYWKRAKRRTRGAKTEGENRKQQHKWQSNVYIFLIDRA